MKRIAVSLVGIVLALALSLVSQTALASSSCRDNRVGLRGDWGAAEFRVDLADTPEERSQGLMFVDKMAADKGMLFVYERPQVAAFWMRNTLIPLDMIFAGPDGVVTRVHHDAIPGDETVIDGGPGVSFVLEINGGLARRMGIDAGSQLRHPAIGPAAAWPCD